MTTDANPCSRRNTCPAATSSSACSCTSVRSLLTERVCWVHTAAPAASRCGTSAWNVTSWRGCIRQTTVVAPGTVASTPRTVAPSDVVSSCTDVTVDDGRSPATR